MGKLYSSLLKVVGQDCLIKNQMMDMSNRYYRHKNAPPFQIIYCYIFFEWSMCQGICLFLLFCLPTLFLPSVS